MTSLALAVGLLVVVQFPLLNIIYFVDLHVYLIAFVLSAATIVGVTLLCGGIRATWRRESSLPRPYATSRMGNWGRDKFHFLPRPRLTRLAKSEIYPDPNLRA